MERRDVYENELTEEERPDGPEQDDIASEEHLDPDVDSEEDDASMEADVFGKDERG